MAVPDVAGRKVTVQLPTAVVPERVQLGPRVPVDVPERVKLTAPDGVVGPAFVSVTVAVQVEAWFTTTGVSQETLVVVP